jgi:hypothetical protein
MRLEAILGIRQRREFESHFLILMTERPAAARAAAVNDKGLMKKERGLAAPVPGSGAIAAI